MVPFTGPHMRNEYVGGKKNLPETCKIPEEAALMVPRVFRGGSLG